MPLTIKKVIAAFDALSALIESDNKNKFVFPTAVRIKFALNLRLIRPVMEEYHKEHNKLVMKYGEQQADGSWRVVSPTLLEKFSKERDDAQAVETDVKMSPVAMTDLGENQLPIDLIVVLLESGLVTE